MKLPLPSHLTAPAAPAKFRSTPKRDEEDRLGICITGFETARKHELKALAEAADLRVITTVTKGVQVLIAGKTAGPTKVADAKEQGAAILSEAVFTALLDDAAANGRTFGESLAEYLAAAPDDAQLAYCAAHGIEPGDTWHDCDRAIDAHRRDAWKALPATRRQLEYLTDLGVETPAGITGGEASALIAQHGGKALK